MINIKEILFFYSRYSVHCKNVTSFLKRFNIPIIHPICVDAKNIRKIVRNNSLFKISHVPSIIVIYDDSAEMYEGHSVLQWFKEFIKTIRELEHEQKMNEQEQINRIMAEEHARPKMYSGGKDAADPVLMGLLKEPKYSSEFDQGGEDSGGISGGISGETPLGGGDDELGVAQEEEDDYELLEKEDDGSGASTSAGYVSNKDQSYKQDIKEQKMKSIKDLARQMEEQRKQIYEATYGYSEDKLPKYS